MGFKISADDFVKYLQQASKVILNKQSEIEALDEGSKKEYGWAEIAEAFLTTVSNAETYSDLPIFAVLRRTGLLLMGRIGSDSALLFGSAYVSASERIIGKEYLKIEDLCSVFEAMCEDMMKRGKSKPGEKTIIDTIYPAKNIFRLYLDEGMEEVKILHAVKKAALNGATATKDMKPESSGRIDTGAYVMALRIECLCDYIENNLII